MDNYKYLKVFYNDILVGTLAKTHERVVAFEYDSDWLNNGFSISPFSLPLIKKVLSPNTNHLVDYSAFSMTVYQTAGDGCLLTDCS